MDGSYIPDDSHTTHYKGSKLVDEVPLQVHQLWSLFQSKEPRNPDHRCDLMLIDINYIECCFFSVVTECRQVPELKVEYALHNMCVDKDAVMNMDMGMEMVMDMAVDMDMDTVMYMMNGCPCTYA